MTRQTGSVSRHSWLRYTRTLISHLPPLDHTAMMKASSTNFPRHPCLVFSTMALHIRFMLDLLSVILMMPSFHCSAVLGFFKSVCWHLGFFTLANKSFGGSVWSQIIANVAGSIQIKLKDMELARKSTSLKSRTRK